MNRLRLAARVAARETRRRPARSLLVVILVALPVAGMTAATTILRTEARTPLRVFEDSFGLADAGFDTFVEAGTAVEDGPALQTVAELAPAGTEVTTLTTVEIGMRNATETAYAVVTTGDVTAPIFGGRYVVLDGRTTRAGGEVALSPEMASRFDVGVGDRLVLERPDVELDVVGIIEDTRDLDTTSLFFADRPPDALRPQFGASTRVLIDVPGDLDAERVLQLIDDRDAGLTDVGYFEVRPTPELVDALLERYPWLADEREAAVRWSIVAGALVLAVVGIVIAAAFTVGARQQLTTLGQLSANGASEKLLRRVLVLQGTVTGLAGAIAGVALASVGVRLARGPMERLADHRIPPFETRWSDVATIMAVGIVAASVAALIPARSAARIPTLRALAGRRPEPPVSRRLTGSGVLVFVGGLGLFALAAIGGTGGTDANLWAGIAIVGGLGVLFGATATTPALVAAIAPLAARTRGVTRIAVRNLTRHRTRTGAVVAAVAAAGALAVGGTAIARSAIADDQAYTSLSPSTVSVNGFDPGVGRSTQPPSAAVARVAAVLQSASRHQLGVAGADYSVQYERSADHGFDDGTAHVVDDADAEALRLDPAVRSALREDGIVLVRFVDDDLGGDVAVTFDGQEPVTTSLVFSRYSLGSGSGLYITPEFAEQRGLDTRPGPMLFSLPDPMTEVERFDLDQLRNLSWQTQDAAMGDPTGTPPSTAWEINYRTESSRISGRVIESILAATATLLALVVLGIGLALAAADDREDATTLTVVGASPRVRSMTTATKAWVMATLGFLLSIPIGFLPVRVVRSSTVTTSAPFPTSTVVALVVVAPLIAAVLTFAVSSVAGRIRPLRMSTALFD